jgi:hypothetical protein
VVRKIARRVTTVVVVLAALLSMCAPAFAKAADAYWD